MLYVKIMSDENMPDTVPHKNFKIVPIANSDVMQFINKPKSLQPEDSTQSGVSYRLLVDHADGDSDVYELHGNAYVMNEAGKTIAIHGA